MTEENFGKALCADRLALGFTQEKFCSAILEFTGKVVCQQTLARWEKGAIPRYDSCVQLFSFLKHIFEVRGLESEVIKLRLPEPTKHKNNVAELLKTLDDQALEIAKLKDVIRTLIS